MATFGLFPVLDVTNAGIALVPPLAAKPILGSLLVHE